jgi:outer membrane protein OmpA-like peptidoglycan-associated protein
LLVAWEPPQARDADADGLEDEVDACREEPEDRDQYRDDDGCPDPSVAVRVRVVDAEGAALPGATATLAGEGGRGDGTGEVSAHMHPGTYRVSASAAGYRSLERDETVPVGASHDIVVQLEAILGTLRVRVVDEAGQPLEATISVGDSALEPTAGGVGESQLRPGTYPVVVRAEGFAPARLSLDVPADGTVEGVATLHPVQTKITREKIDIAGKIYFDVNAATIKPESFPLLDEVASALLDHPEITRVRIEGHTDNRGPDASNLQLSDRRAASVRQYLLDRGVAADRLESAGYGETRPVDPRNNAAAWDKNRRVEFMIAARSE